MKRLVIFSLLLLPILLSAQPLIKGDENRIVHPDSLLSAIPLPDGHCNYLTDQQFILDSATFISWRDVCDEWQVLNSWIPDFDRSFFVFAQSGGDCHATFAYKLLEDPKKKTLIVRIYNILGGCRAGGFFDHALIISLPPDFKHYEVEEVLAKYREDPETGERKIVPD